MRHGSLFSGIGGFDLAAEWMGWENVFHCEWNPFGQKVLHYYWPEAEQFTDITKSDFTKYANKIDILTGGFPCQPYSMAGKRLGKEDDRHLWPEMLRAIREIQPKWIVGENVFGLVNWNGGLVFEEVQTDLEAQGYEVQPYVLPAAAVNAPHRRDRVWFVASKNTNKDGWRGKLREKESNKWEQRNIGAGNNECIQANNGETWSSSNSSSQRLERERRPFGELERRFRFGSTSSRINECTSWQNFPTVSPICNGDDGFSNRLDGITFSKWRAESIKAGGNAIVPQVALQIFKAIEQFEKLNS
jgi:DNA (cytosine-5)-methyltransferase 1